METDEIVRSANPRGVNRSLKNLIKGERESKVKAHWELDADCPIKADIEAAVSIGEQLMTIIQRLQRDLEGCELCSDWENCQIFQSLNPVIDEVILEINEEWGLDI